MTSLRKKELFQKLCSLYPDTFKSYHKDSSTNIINSPIFTLNQNSSKRKSIDCFKSFCNDTGVSSNPHHSLSKSKVSNFSKKEGLSFLEENYIKQTKSIQKYFTNNKNGMKLKGSKKYENMPAEKYLDDLQKYKQNIIKKFKVDNDMTCINFLDKCSKSFYNKLELTPLPNKSRLLMNSSKERDDYNKAERLAVQMRQIEFTHQYQTEQGKQRLQNHIKEQNDKILQILWGAATVIQRWWRKLKLKKNKGKCVGSSFGPKRLNTLDSCSNANYFKTNKGKPIQKKKTMLYQKSVTSYNSRDSFSPSSQIKKKFRKTHSKSNTKFETPLSNPSIHKIRSNIQNIQKVKIKNFYEIIKGIFEAQKRKKYYFNLLITNSLLLKEKQKKGREWNNEMLVQKINQFSFKRRISPSKGDNNSKFQNLRPTKDLILNIPPNDYKKFKKLIVQNNITLISKSKNKKNMPKLKMQRVNDVYVNNFYDNKNQNRGVVTNEKLKKIWQCKDKNPSFITKIRKNYAHKSDELSDVTFIQLYFRNHLKKKKKKKEELFKLVKNKESQTKLNHTKYFYHWKENTQRLKHVEKSLRLFVFLLKKNQKILKEKIKLINYLKNPFEKLKKVNKRFTIFSTRLTLFSNRSTKYSEENKKIRNVRSNNTRTNGTMSENCIHDTENDIVEQFPVESDIANISLSGNNSSTRYKPNSKRLKKKNKHEKRNIKVIRDESLTVSDEDLNIIDKIQGNYKTHTTIFIEKINNNCRLQNRKLKNMKTLINSITNKYYQEFLSRLVLINLFRNNININDEELMSLLKLGDKNKYTRRLVNILNLNVTNNNYPITSISFNNFVRKFMYHSIQKEVEEFTNLANLLDSQSDDELAPEIQTKKVILKYETKKQNNQKEQRNICHSSSYTNAPQHKTIKNSDINNRSNKRINERQRNYSENSRMSSSLMIPKNMRIAQGMLNRLSKSGSKSKYIILREESFDNVNIG